MIKGNLDDALDPFTLKSPNKHLWNVKNHFSENYFILTCRLVNMGDSSFKPEKKKQKNKNPLKYIFKNRKFEKNRWPEKEIS